MNDLGVTLAWLAVQVALVLAPALALQTLAARKGPAAGAWVAALSLGLVVVLSVWALLPVRERPGAIPAARRAPFHTEAGAVMVAEAAGRADAGPHAGLGLDLAALARAWARLERGASAPAARCRPWGSALAGLALAGTGAGLLHLALGLWAIGLCRRRGRPVDDPGMTALLEELRSTMECRPRVALIEVRDLATPATAGWRRPVILLPDGWRSWDDGARRAVLAHELAHVVRGDYAAGLVARLALALNAFHPLVRWMAGRLQLQQELAADALGARYAGGRARYLVALSQLVLEQDGRSPSWPVRAFLPRRGALIRRIAMLRDEGKTAAFGRAWRIVSAAGLLGLTVAVGLLRGPARGDEPAPLDTATAQIKQTTAETRTAPLYVRDGKDGVVVIRPAATVRRAGMTLLMPFLDPLDVELARLAKELKIDATRPGLLKLQCSDIEWVTGNIGFGRTKNTEQEELHSVMLGNPAIRTVAPFDWLAFLRQWRCELEEVHIEKGVYFKVKGPIAALVGPNPCVYLPDDRTLVFDDESTIRALVGDPMKTPAYLRNADWEQASRGLVAVAIKNQDEMFAKHYDLGRTDDALVLSLFKGVDRWIFSVDDADPIILNAVAACRSADAGDALTRAIASLRSLGQVALEHPDPEALKVEAGERAYRMAKALLANLGVVKKNGTVQVHANGFGTIADYAAVLEAEVREANAQSKDDKNEPKGVKR
ncbi:MAG: M56 family metallopeptidase [Isosphaeraceae bacterium]|nr:M56 family metallopeptidase [Isosphaeraceae bacterium]